MGLLFNRRKKPQIREDTITPDMSDPLLRALIGGDSVDRNTAMNIPAVAACVNMIADTVSSLKVKLYRRTDDRVEEVTGDRRTYLLNEDTGDTLDAVQFKKAMVTDMYMGRGGYAFVNKQRGEVKSIHYVEAERVGFLRNTDPIFKDYQIEVDGRSYEPWQFITLLRNTRTGAYGKSIIDECRELLDVIYSTQQYEKSLVKKGGNKKGFLKAKNKLTDDAMSRLKTAFRRLYANNSESVLILNDGLEFQESANTSVEMQMNENKTTNNDDVCKIFLVPPSMVNGRATEEDKKQYYQNCILPILERFAAAINRAMLREDEKGTLFFAFDDTDLTKGDIQKRFGAYKVALESGFMQLDEVRKQERLPEFGLDFIKLGLQDVLYYPKENKVYTPNTNKMSSPVEEGGVAPVQQEGGTNEG